MIKAFKFCAQAIFNLLEKTHPPGSQKPPLAKLRREMHHIYSGYIDDFYLQGHTYES
jgi:hypothetical protein